MKILVLGYGSYNGYLFNSCIDVALEIKNRLSTSGNVVYVKILRVSLSEVSNFFSNELEKIQPDIIIGLGMYPGARMPILEAAAINIASYRIPDADHKIYPYKRLFNNEPLIRTPIFDPAHIIEECRKINHNITVGLSTGTYLCNALAYHIYRWSRETGRLGVFFHIPMISDTLMKNNMLGQDNYPLVSLHDVVEPILCVLNKLLNGFEKQGPHK